MSDNPFSEPESTERTVIRPNPGGPRPAGPRDAGPRNEGPAPDRRGPIAPPIDSIEVMAIGVNPLVAEAAPLLQLMARLRNTLNQPDPGDLRERAVAAMRVF